MVGKQRLSFLIVFLGSILVWTGAMFYLGKGFPASVVAFAVLIALWALGPAAWFAIEQYGWNWEPNSNRVRRYARGLWMAAGAIALLLTIRAIVLSQSGTWNRGPVAWNVVLDIIKISIWPMVVLLSLALFREPLGAFFTALGARASKIGAFNVSIELTALPEARAWSGPTLNDLKSEYPSTASDSSGSLFTAIADTTNADYLIVNLEDGNAWLTSRLFILASLIPRIRPIKRIVFLSDPAEQFVGEARPADVATALALKYPWLEQLYIACHVSAFPDAGGCKLNHSHTLLGSLKPTDGSQILSDYLYRVQGTPEPTGWVTFQYYSEHAEWLTKESLIQLLGKKLNRDTVKRDPVANETTLGRAILRRDADFVAIVDAFDRFDRLIDRHRALDEVVRRETSTPPSS